MALVVETGVGVAGANSYVSLVDAQAIVDLRGLGSVLTEAALMVAMDALRAMSWQGSKTAQANPLPWPRSGVFNEDGYAVDWESIPDDLKTAQAMLAHYVIEGADFGARTEARVKREKIHDGVEVEYAVSGTQLEPISAIGFPLVAALLKQFEPRSSLGILEHV